LKTALATFIQIPLAVYFAFSVALYIFAVAVRTADEGTFGTSHGGKLHCFPDFLRFSFPHCPEKRSIPLQQLFSDTTKMVVLIIGCC
jgi:hypothetical protein